MNDRIQDYNESVSRPGKFEGETIITPYLYDAMLNGDGELLATMDSGDSVTYFEITGDEFRREFGTSILNGQEWENSTFKSLERGVLSNYFLLIENSDGFCTTMYFNTEQSARDCGEFFLAFRTTGEFGPEYTKQEKLIHEAMLSVVHIHPDMVDVLFWSVLELLTTDQANQLEDILTNHPDMIED